MARRRSLLRQDRGHHVESGIQRDGVEEGITTFGGNRRINDEFSQDFGRTPPDSADGAAIGALSSRMPDELAKERIRSGDFAAPAADRLQILDGGTLARLGSGEAGRGVQSPF